MNFTQLRYGLCFLFIIFNTLLQAQPLMRHIEKLTTDNGLSNNIVTDVAQDPQGFLWIATWHGLNRFDGTEVVKYFATKQSGSLPGNIIYRLIPSDSFHIVLATHHGLSVLDTRTDSFRNILSPLSNSVERTGEIQEPQDNRIFIMEKDSNGNFWIGTPSCIYRLDKNLQLQKTFYSGYRIRDIEGTRIQYVYKIISLSTGEVLFWLASGVHVWQPDRDTLMKIESTQDKRGKFLHNSSPNQCFRIFNRYLVFINYKKNTLYVLDELTDESASCPLPGNNKNQTSFIQHISGLDNGWMAISFGPNGVAWVQLQYRNGKLTLSPDRSIYLPAYAFGKWETDSEGNLWITTSMDGMLKVSPGKQVFETKVLNNRPENKVSAYETMSFYQIKKQLFVGTANDGFYEWNLITGNIRHQSAKHGSHTENTVWNFRSNSDDTLWLGTQQGLLWYNIRNKKLGRLTQPHPAMLDSFAITTQFTDSKGLVWMEAGYGKGVCVYDPVKRSFKVFSYNENAYPYRYPVAIEEDRNNNLWFISDATPHLVQWIRKENRFQKIIIPQFQGTTYAQSGGFYLDAEKGLIWYGLQSAGLVRYNMRNGNVKVYGTEDGLKTDLIYSIEEDKKGVLWLSTAQGISSFDPHREYFVNYQRIDGLPSSYFSAKIHYDTLADRMYAGAPGKAVYFSPSALQKKEKPVQALLTGLLINNTPVPLPVNHRLSLPWRSNDIMLSFTGINLTNGTENKYAYRMGDEHAEWVNIGSQRQVRFANLNPGHYFFEIKALHKDGNWSMLTDSLELNIRKPFVSTTWFYLICFVATCGMIYGWYKYRFIQLLRMERMRSRISHDLHDEIGSRLTNIGMMSQIVRQKQTNDNANTSWLQQIQEESEAISQSMREIIWNINPENDSMEEAMPRMLRFATGLLESKGIVVQAFIPEMKGIKIDMEKRRDMFAIFKETIHNIARHSDAKHTSISVSIEKKKFRLEIADDGKGFAKDELAFHNGLKYMYQRSEKNSWRLDMISRPGEGTRLILEMKIT